MTEWFARGYILLTTYCSEFLDNLIIDLVVFYQMTNPPFSARGLIR